MRPEKERVSLEELRASLAGDVTPDFDWSGAELPRLGQDVATGERRERGSGGKRRDVDAAGG
jgi:hypothetical protein